MPILRSYLIFAILRGVATVLAVLVLVLAFVQFVGQLGDVGTANFGFAEAVAYVGLGLPRMVFQTLPAAALVGTLLALGNLAVHHELVVMRASGVSKAHFVMSVGMAGLVLMITMALLGESIAPSLGAYARQMRAQALFDDMDASSDQTWSRVGDRIFNLRREVGSLGFGSGVKVFELGADQGIDRIVMADSAEVYESTRWSLSNYAETRFQGGDLAARRQAQAVIDFDLNPDMLELSVVRQDLLATPNLRRYINHLETNRLDADSYLTAYWGRVANVVSVLFMTLLALPFVFGGLRSAGTGARLVVGLVVGLGFYVLDEMLANSGEVFDLDPVVVAWAPTAALALVTVLAILKFR